MYKIYKLTVPNGKVYIGTTKQEKLHKRWQYGSGYSANKPFYNDILEYGWKNIEQEVLEEVETLKEAHTKEREYILKYRSNESEYGYNSHTNTSIQGEKKHTYTRCKKTGELFYSMRLAGEKYGVSASAISYAIMNNTPCAGMYWEKLSLTQSEFENF